MENIPQCAICGTTQQLLRCAKCKTIFYCSTAHQHMHWPAHKRPCRMLAKQKNNNRIQHLQQAVAATTLNNSITPSVSTTSSSASVAGHQRWSTTSENGVGTIGFGPLDGTGDAEIDPSVLTAVAPINAMPGNNENGVVCNQSNEVTTTIVASATNGLQSTDIDNVAGACALPNVSAVTASCLQPQYNHVDPRLFTPQYHQQQQLLMQQQLQFQQPAPSQVRYQSTSNICSRQTHNHYEKTISCQIGSGGAADENAFKHANGRRYDDLCNTVINDMNLYGLSVVDDFLGVDKGLDILNEVQRMYATGVFKDGQLVNNMRQEESNTIRGDKITWVKGVEPGCANVGYLINQIDAVICRANAMKNNGKLGDYNIKERTKAMVACYPGSGSRYVVHIDNPNKDGRVITAIYYLNVNWDTMRSGGILRIFPEQGNTVADIAPKFDRLIFFWSDKRNPHEVQASHRTRYAITVWYFDADEREAALNRIKNNKNNAKATTSITAATNANSTTTAAAAPTNNGDNTNNTNTSSQRDTTNNAASAAIIKTTTPANTENTDMVTNARSNANINNSQSASINKSTTANFADATNTNNTNENANVNANNDVPANSSEFCT